MQKYPVEHRFLFVGQQFSPLLFTILMKTHKMRVLCAHRLYLCSFQRPSQRRPNPSATARIKAAAQEIDTAKTKESKPKALHAKKKKPNRKEDAKTAKLAEAQSLLALENSIAAEKVKKESSRSPSRSGPPQARKRTSHRDHRHRRTEATQALAKEARFREETAQLAREASFAKMEAETLGAYPQGQAS